MANLNRKDRKEHIRDVITSKIQEERSSLEEIIEYISDEDITAVTINHDYIKQEYINYCSQFWLQEIRNFFKEAAEHKNWTTILPIFNELDNIQDLKQIPEELSRQLQYHELLIVHYEMISKEDEKRLINRFKSECLEQVLAYSSSAQTELAFFEAFVDFLSTFKNFQTVTSNLELKDFYDGRLSFNEFIKKIMNLNINISSEKLTTLKEAAAYLQQEESLFLIEKFKQIVGAYVEPIMIEEKQIDGRLIIEVTGVNIAINEILQSLKNKILQNSNIEEVRLIGKRIIHIDADLENTDWHGKNIAIFTEMIKIHGNVTWDVSGKDNNHTYSSNAGTEEDGHGKDGVDGYPGESGGNVLILSKKIEDLGNFKIISNGGGGSKGQDGGNGENGADGIGITKTDFDKQFPAVAILSLPRIVEIHKVIRSIYESGFKKETVWHTGTANTVSGIIDDIDYNSSCYERMSDFDTDELPSYHSIFAGVKENLFIEVTREQGSKIIFSFQSGGFFQNCQAFLLYKGTLGKQGGSGGKYGLGGQGGYPGEVIIKNPESNMEFDIIKSTEQGKEGQRGECGSHGKHGKNGWDMGYVDHQYWTRPVFYGTDHNSKLTLHYYNDGGSDRVWCPYTKRYAAITASRIEHVEGIQYEARQDSRRDGVRQPHAQAIRKKNISQSAIVANYSHHLNSTERSTLQNLQSNIENIRQCALQAVIQHQAQQERQNIERETMRSTILVDAPTDP